MPTFNDLVHEYGLTIALSIWFLYKEIWPFIRDKVWPARAAAAATAHKAALHREDRVITAIEQSARAWGSLETTLGAMSTQMREQAEAIHTLNEDVAGLYGKIDAPRPSRQRAPRPPQEPR